MNLTHPAVNTEVTVYEKPATRENPEGRAVILAAHDTPDYFRVRFLDDGFEADRFICHLGD